MLARHHLASEKIKSPLYNQITKLLIYKSGNYLRHVADVRIMLARSNMLPLLYKIYTNLFKGKFINRKSKLNNKNSHKEFWRPLLKKLSVQDGNEFKEKPWANWSVLKNLNQKIILQNSLVIKRWEIQKNMKHFFTINFYLKTSI